MVDGEETPTSRFGMRVRPAPPTPTIPTPTLGGELLADEGSRGSTPTPDGSNVPFDCERDTPSLVLKGEDGWGVAPTLSVVKSGVDEPDTDLTAACMCMAFGNGNVCFGIGVVSADVIASAVIVCAIAMCVGGGGVNDIIGWFGESGSGDKLLAPTCRPDVKPRRSPSNKGTHGDDVECDDDDEHDAADDAVCATDGAGVGVVLIVFVVSRSARLTNSFG